MSDSSVQLAACNMPRKTANGTLHRKLQAAGYTLQNNEKGPAPAGPFITR